MKGFIIDARDRMVTEHDFGRGELANMRAVSPPGCSGFNRVPLLPESPRGDSLWVDGEGMLSPDRPVFFLKGYLSPLAGPKAIVLGLDQYGENRSAKASAEEVLSRIRWTHLATTGRMTEPFEPTPGHIVMGDPILEAAASWSPTTQVSSAFSWSLQGVVRLEDVGLPGHVAPAADADAIMALLEEAGVPRGTVVIFSTAGRGWNAMGRRPDGKVSFLPLDASSFDEAHRRTVEALRGAGQ